MKRVYASFVGLYFSFLHLTTTSSSVAQAEPITFRFEAVLFDNQDPSFPFPVGQRVSGSYAFELGTPGTTFPSPYTFTSYYDAVISFSVTLDGFGTSTGHGGEIALGDPVQTFGSFNFLADEYFVAAPVSGLTIPTLLGDRRLVRAQIHLADLDQIGLESESLSATPPNLGPFLDHTGPNFDSDKAQLNLIFDYPDGSRSAIPFRLTFLGVVPEPDLSVWAISMVTLVWTGRCYRMRRRCS